MIGNDIVDLSCAPRVTGKHLTKYYSREDLANFGENEYWEVLSLKESAWKCIHKLIGLDSFIPPHFTVGRDKREVFYESFTLPVILHEVNEEYIHSIVGTRGVTGWRICGEGEHRTSFEREYEERWGISPTVVKVPSGRTPNGMSPPIVMNDPRTSVTFSHDGRFSSYAYKICG